MRPWLRRIRGAVIIGLIWAVVWAPIGVLIGMIVDPDGSMDEPWLLVGAYPGFLGGVAFAALLGAVGRRRRFGELSVPRFAAWGAAAGLGVGGLWLALASASDPPRWALNAVVVGSVTLLSSISAAGSLALARRAQKGATVGASAHRRDAPLGDGESAELLGAGTDPAAWNRPADARAVGVPVVRGQAADPRANEDRDAPRA